ncbi:MAG: adenylate kinase [Candidatus Latescibacteria bacterium]|nr:adenylate kinase [Candidatus Latescibacterota bacterium]
MRLILLGAPASGKGTQAERLTCHLKADHISTGDMLRQVVAARTDLGLVMEMYLKHGHLVPDHHAIQLVEQRFADSSAADGFIMDGFPRTLSQAHHFDAFLEGKGLDLDAIVLVDVPDNVLLDRITGRRADPETGRIYHLTFNPPPADILPRLVQRDDDTEAVMEGRLATYHREIDPVIAHYRQAKNFIQVNGDQPVDQVFQAIIHHLDNLVEQPG